MTKYEVKGRYMKVSYELFEVLSLEAGLLLSYIIDTYSNPNLRFKDGYARYTTTYIQEAIPLSEYQIRKALNEIEQEGFASVKVEKSRTAKQRWIQLNNKELDKFFTNEYVDEYEEENVKENTKEYAKEYVKKFKNKHTNTYNTDNKDNIYNIYNTHNIKEDISLTRNISESSILDESTIRLLLSNDEENKPISYNEYLTKEKENNINPPSPLLSNSQPAWLNNERKVELANEVY